MANKFGLKHTVVMADQALHDISNGLREQASLMMTLEYYCHVCVVSSRWKRYGRSRNVYCVRLTI